MSIAHSSCNLLPFVFWYEGEGWAEAPERKGHRVIKPACLLDAPTSQPFEIQKSTLLPKIANILLIRAGSRETGSDFRRVETIKFCERNSVVSD
ncbi:hypothetical protein [Exiguobacterium artemiae]|uniref:hypothetical protein n=1 Tax=Exiguobacterium artemiae TaxID=340145 RepID=UPI002964FF68|nr:hypothetical protein [Exiguobacterium sibiricum]MDW2886687.1 hypothetical protein [Exiguobacterium sibiricum]